MFTTCGYFKNIPCPLFKFALCVRPHCPYRHQNAVGRTADDIVRWLKKKTGPPARELTTVDAAKALIDSAEVVVIGFFKNQDSSEAKICKNVAAEIDDFVFGITSDDAVYSELKVSKDGAILFKKFDEGRNEYDGEYSEDELKKFMKANSLPLVVEFNHETAQKIFGGDIKAHNFLFISKSSSEYESKIEVFRSVAKEFKSKVLFVTIDVDEEDHERILKFFGLSKTEAPCMRIIKLEEEVTKFKPETDGVTAEDIKKFVNTALEGKLKVVQYNGEHTLEGIAQFIETGGDYGRAAPDEVVDFNGKRTLEDTSRFIESGGVDGAAVKEEPPSKKSKAEIMNPAQVMHNRFSQHQPRFGQLHENKVSQENSSYHKRDHLTAPSALYLISSTSNSLQLKWEPVKLATSYLLQIQKCDVHPGSSTTLLTGQSETPLSFSNSYIGYNQQMAPPAAMHGNKMHQNMMGGSSSHMPFYSSQSTGYYPQNGYHRPPGTMHSYGSQAQNNYQGSSYPVQSPLGGPHRMPSHPSSGGPSNFNTPAGGLNYNSSQYSGTPPSSGFAMNNMMPPPNQYPKSAVVMSPPTGGAEAAAQAAVIAAAASSTHIRQSPMYLRQHLQQKIYANNYNSAISPGASGSNGGQETPMPLPASMPSSHPMSLNQNSMPSSSVSLGNVSSCDGPVPASIVPAGFTQTSAPSSLGIFPTAVTQSISSPVPSAVTVSSPSVPDMMQSQQVQNTSMGDPQGPPSPPVMDEGSQASNASASSSLPEEQVETSKPNNKPVMSHPPTPNTLPSPGAASMSSFHDEFESVSSPSWPRAPASPHPDGILQLYDLSDDPDRRLFLDKLIMYQEERGTPLSQCPTISKQPLDLYRLYLAAKEQGGFLEVMKGKMWKEIAILIGIGASSSVSCTLRKQYIKHLLPFECKFDRGGIDPGSLISSLESNSTKKNAKNAGRSNMNMSTSNKQNVTNAVVPNKYDELVPSTLTTQFGGFYINKGDLEFRNLGDDGGYDSKLKKRRFKGIDKDGRKKRRFGSEENQKRRGRKPLNDSVSALIKPVKKTQPSVAGMLQQQKAKLQLLQQEGLQQMQLNPITVEREIEPEEVVENHVAEVLNQVAVTPVQGSTITEAIESVVKAAAEEISNESAGPITGSSDGEEVIKPPVENIEAPKLPDNLPPELDDVVAKLKEINKKQKTSDKRTSSGGTNSMNEPGHKRPIVIDGSNVAMQHGNGQCYSVRGIQLVINEFLEMGHDKIIAFVPRHRKSSQQSKRQKTTDQYLFESLERDGHLVFTPSRFLEGKRITSYDDRFILDYAVHSGGVVVSNDQFRDLFNEKEAYKEVIRHRLLPFCIVEDKVLLPYDPLGQDGPPLNEFLSF